MVRPDERDDGDESVRVLSIGAANPRHRAVERLLAAASELRLDVVPGFETALDHVKRHRSDIVLLQPPERDGQAAFHSLATAAPQARIITIEGSTGSPVPGADGTRHRVSLTDSAESIARCVLDAAERHRLTAQIENTSDRLQEIRSRFRNIIEKTGDGILILSEDRIIRFANPAAEALFGRSADHLLGTEFGHTLISGETTEIDIVGQSDGEARTAELRISDTEWEGEAAQLISLRDISDRRRAEERAQQLILEQAAREQAEAAAARSELLSEVSSALDEASDLEQALVRVADLLVERFTEWCLLESSLRGGDPLLIGRHRVRPQAENLQDLELRYEEAISGDHPPFPDVRVEGAALFRELNAEARATLAADSRTERALEELGTRSAVVVAMKSSDQLLGHLIFARSDDQFDSADLTTAIDVAERVCRKIQNARLYEEALAASKAKSDFLAIISHELRTPLNAILGYNQIILAGIAGDLDAQQRKYMERIDSSAHHLLRIIDEILAFRMVEQGNERLNTRSVTVEELKDEVVSLATPLFREKGLEFSVELDDPAGTLTTDVAKVRQILLSLLSNAAKFTEEGRVELRIELDEEMMTATVVDSGIGIAPEHIGAIFDSFWQAEPTYTRVRGGTGLGLSVAKRLAIVLGGDLDVASEEGVGSQFMLRIPRVAPEQPASDAVGESGPPQ